MKKINLKKQLLAFGTPCVDQNGSFIMMNQAIANCLIQGNSGNPVKMMSICIRLYDIGILELDEQDLGFLKSNISKCQTATDLLLSATLQEIDEQSN
jgi:hypothetical protein